MHLAQLNVAHLRAPIDAPELATFVELLEPINDLADSAPGFVWRLKESDEDPTATVVHEYGDHLLVNFSVWDSIENLWNFVYRSAHLGVLRRRREWFLRMAQPYTVMWWVPEGVVPTLAEAMVRLDHLKAVGSSPAAFTFQEPYDSNEAANLPAAAEVRK
ncbi:DUF3291 domain-containing protein [Nonomuraea muscovyensis]|jgi:hypothetical protein|uniref:DUF3291 domain-containing protein n=1 Tax=Nonomuraea muscovyensis TaxID=1124761 RepID=A0A7X0EY59_9ACTN|nr:DUF3291 domain-containing protein [Nonomuraea muscovyensis]MBB6348333.1 hypothetical protein [Nonomuraea muscovyensis]MDF2708673.1 hypothetical protein [Nonomuraea muscovyensis]